jgi:hypothetical protein
VNFKPTKKKVTFSLIITLVWAYIVRAMAAGLLILCLNEINNTPTVGTDYSSLGLGWLQFRYFKISMYL